MKEVLNKGIKEVILMDRNAEREKLLHYAISSVGGFLGAYAIFNYCDFFGNAQTTNWIYLVLAIVGHNFGEFLIRFIGVMLYMAGAFFSGCFRNNKIFHV